MNCPHCHAAVPTGYATCPDCGAAMHGDEGKDEGIYPELARANLLRMRGDAHAAESLLLSLLKRYPSNASAHEMLGDLRMEAGDSVQASEWYELALDLSPETPGLAEKMLRAKNTVVADEDKETDQHLGLQTSPSNKMLGVAIVAIVILALIILGLLALLNRNTTPVVIRSVVAAPPEASAPASPVPTSTPLGSIAPASMPTAQTQDQVQMTYLAQHSTDGTRILTLVGDPREQAVVITYGIQKNENPKPIAARLAKIVLDTYASYAKVTMRASLDGNIIYMGDALRSRYEETQAAVWQENNPGGDAWMAYIFTNEWPAVEVSAAPSTEESPTAAATSPGSIVPVHTP